MPEIRPSADVVTQITTVKTRPETQDEVLALMKERAKFMSRQPGFVSVTLHRGEDGMHVVNYLQWTDRERLVAAHHSPEFRKKWPKFGELVQDVEPALYDVVLTEAA
jgi:heme-degrading monooxygenase HmoA